MISLSLPAARWRRNALLRAAVHQNRAVTRQGILERLFTLAFSGLVYPQIWEDPEADLEALQLGPDSHVVSIASGGCNVLSYLIADPARITAVDLNPAHIALGELKRAAALHLPDHATFSEFLRDADSKRNITHYDRLLAGALPAEARAYWEARDWRGRRRISLFARKFYRFGLLGRCIGLGHALARAYRIDLAGLLTARDPAKQRAHFERHIAPLFEKRLVRWLTSSPVSLYGLGIPPAQYRALAEGRPMAEVLRERLARLDAGFPLADNYFAWQGFARRYPADLETCLPPYLQAAHFKSLRERATRLRFVRQGITELMEGEPGGSVDAVVLLDAQDWMTPAQLDRLWRAITGAARPGARVVFRTAGRASVLPGRLDPALLARWDYDEGASAAMLARDRSAIYGGCHLYRLRA
jgi:S-adenosylmethionine-diacylglycerol 3-amino-3-carboxypropyl transferase